MSSSAASLPLIARAQAHGDRLAASDPAGTATYRELLSASERVARCLLDGRPDLHEERIAFLVPPGLGWIALLWGIWRAGGIAVPLPMSSTRPELEYFVTDSGAAALLFDSSTAPLLEPLAGELGLRALAYETAAAAPPAEAPAALPSLEPERRALIIYTSGTTNRPKGVVTTHANLTAQITTLIRAWEWQPSDRIPLFLPLHHVHGVVNVLLCALWAGAHCEIHPRFDAALVWDRIASGELTLLMAVPTIYYRLIEAFDQAAPERQQRMRQGCQQIRLMVSGSAALPVSTLERWCQISGHTLLERYGMTEIGMALSNPLHGLRVPGSVGQPLPGVQARIVDEQGRPLPPGHPGEVQIQGPSVFREYWGKPDATREAFRNGWFLTGDVAVIENGSWRLLGRASIDILKSGGHKLSALEIEETLRQHPSIAEVAVVGAPDAEWGERVAAAIVLHPGHALDLPTLREWARELLAPYKIPTRLLTLDALPRNAMGKVVKPSLTKLFEN